MSLTTLHWWDGHIDFGDHVAVIPPELVLWLYRFHPDNAINIYLCLIVGIIIMSVS